MKKILLSIAGCALVAALSACGESEVTTNELDFEKIEKICELSSLEVICKNVAAVDKGDSGLSKKLHLDRKWWAEFEGKVSFSYDMDKVKIVQDGEHITITLPQPEIETSVVDDTFDADSIVTSSKKLFNINKIDLETQVSAMDAAMTTMEEQIKEDSDIIAQSQEHTQNLICNYINGVGEATGVEYTIDFVNEEASK